MRINKDSLKARVNNISRELDITQNVIYNRFFYDAFLSRLSISEHKNKLILKGGLYLSSLLGINTRSTMDIDFYLKKVSMEKDTIVKLVEEIASIDVNDGITFKVVGSSEIREEDSYGGFQITLQAKLDNLKYQFGIDIATGDPIVPSEHTYNYKCLVTEDTLPIKAYSLESVVAEKLQTILSKGIANSRSKDYYDLYILRKTQFENIDNTIIKTAYEKTCTYRNFTVSKHNALELIEAIKDNRLINKRWIAYSKKVKYSEDIPFDDVITAIKEWIYICY